MNTSSHSWSDYLPPVLQLNEVYWIMAICLAARMSCSTIPTKYRLPWVFQLVTFGVSAGLGVWMLASKSVVYALGTALICSSITTTFYDIFFQVIENKIRALTGAEKQLQEPLEYSPPTNQESKP